MKNKLILLVGLMLLNGVVGENPDFTKNVYRDYTFDDTFPDQLLQDCRHCLLTNNSYAFTYGKMTHDITCEPYDPALFSKFGSISITLYETYRENNELLCYGIVHDIVAKVNENTGLWQQFLGMSPFDLPSFGSIPQIIYDEIKKLSGSICLGGFCMDVFFDIGEIVFVLFLFLFELLWFFISNIYLTIILLETFVLISVIHQPTLNKKIHEFARLNKAIYLFLFNFAVSVSRTIISVIRMLRSLIPAI